MTDQEVPAHMREGGVDSGMNEDLPHIVVEFTPEQWQEVLRVSAITKTFLDECRQAGIELPPGFPAPPVAPQEQSK